MFCCLPVMSLQIPEAQSLFYLPVVKIRDVGQPFSKSALTPFGTVSRELMTLTLP